MKVWATSDLHIDYQENFDWFLNISAKVYKEDILIIAGDIVHDLKKMQQLFENLVPKFYKVLFVPGNHDVWLMDADEKDSMKKFEAVLHLAKEEGVQTSPYVTDELSIVPIFSWYDFSFGEPSFTIKRAWRDFKACKWSMNFENLTNYFLEMNQPYLSQTSKEVISFSHFLSSASLIPDRVPPIVKSLIPVFGSQKIEDQLAILKPDLHIYGHSHLNRSLEKDGIWYLNNAFGYPQEANICRKKLMAVYENGAVVKGIKQWPVWKG